MAGGVVRAFVALVVLAACGYPSPLATYCANHPGASGCGDGGVTGDGGGLTIGGAVTGLAPSSGLVLQDNGGDDKPVVSDGPFTFPTPLAASSAYAVTVSVQPTNPSKLCAIANGSGTVGTQDITDVQISCAAASYHVGGSVTGLPAGQSVTLSNNLTENVTVSTNSSFQFPTAIPSGQAFSVTRAAGDASCVVFGGTGTIGNADVTTVVVNCSTTGPFTIGGMIGGLNGTVTLRNSTNGDVVSPNSNGTYAFPTPVASGGGYNVTVVSQPSYPPAAQSCTVANGAGTANGNVVNINVTCTTKTFTVGGSSSGVTGTVVVQNNLTDNKTLPAGNGSYTFATAVASGATYSVTVFQQPASLACSISNRTGTVSNGNITNADVACQYTDPGIVCGSSYCAVGTDVCCDPFGTPSCTTSGSCALLQMPCDDVADCSGGKICCAQTTNGGATIQSVSCMAGCNGLVLCDPNVANACGTKQCKPSQFPPYYACQ